MNIVLAKYNRRPQPKPYALDIVNDWKLMLCSQAFLFMIAGRDDIKAEEVVDRVTSDLMLPEWRLNDVGLETWDIYNVVLALGLGVL